MLIVNFFPIKQSVARSKTPRHQKEYKLRGVPLRCTIKGDTPHEQPDNSRLKKPYAQMV